MLNSIEQFAKHPHLKNAICGTEKGDIKFIPPVGRKKDRKYKKVPQLGEHSDAIKKEFMIDD